MSVDHKQSTPTHPLERVLIQKKGAIINTFHTVQFHFIFNTVPRYTFIVEKQLVVYCSLKYLNTRCRVLTATKANKTERFIRSTAVLDNKSTHSLNARSYCSAPVYTARTTAVQSCSYNRSTLD